MMIKKDPFAKNKHFEESEEEVSVSVSAVSASVSPKVRKILRVALWLSLATGIEFVVAFTMSAGGARTGVFIALTLFKAFYIVAEFMHLGHELRSLIYSVIVPMFFVVLLIYILLYESAALL